MHKVSFDTLAHMSLTKGEHIPDMPEDQGARPAVTYFFPPVSPPPHFPRCSLGAFRLSDSSSPPSAEPFDVVESGPLRLTMLKKSLNPEP